MNEKAGFYSGLMPKRIHEWEEKKLFALRVENARKAKTAHRAKKKALRIAKNKLVRQFKIERYLLSGHRIIVKYIRNYCPTLLGNDDDVLLKFISLKPVISKPVSNDDDFLQTYEWRRLRMEALKKFGARCQCCGAAPKDGIVLNVDHIKPRRLYPELALTLDNLQVLCGPCNHGKGNWDMTDWRGENATDFDKAAVSHIRAIK